LIRFFDNHGMLGVNTHPQWKVLRGGSSTYIAPLTAPYREHIHTGVTLTGVHRHDRGVELKFADGRSAWFDQVVLACHGNQALALLANPSVAERDVLRHFQTSRNETVFHTDENLLPRNTRARASWNYHLNGDRSSGVVLTYHMNRLQSLRTREQFCVTLNPNGHIRPEKVLRRMTYFHPVYTREAIGAQKCWGEISGKNRTHFCGAYWFYGFHEDGLNSALRVARALGVDC
jgi:predicted NAD/FAD-binding protein